MNNSNFIGGSVVMNLGAGEFPTAPRINFSVPFTEENTDNELVCVIWPSILTIEHNPFSGEYAFYQIDDNDEDCYFLEHATPELIDEMIARLQSFKLQAWGDDNA